LPPPPEAHQARLIPAQHDLRLHRPLRADETLQTSARIAMAAPRAPGAFVVFRFEARDAQGKPVTTSDFGVLYRDVQLDGPARALLEVGDPPRHAHTLAKIGDIAAAATPAQVDTECPSRRTPTHPAPAATRSAT